MHLPFVENKGQVTDPNVAYVADTFACRVSVTKDGQIVYGLPGNKEDKRHGLKIKERLLGESVKTRVSGRISHGAKVSYYPGRDKSRWRSNVPTYEQVSLGQVAPGIEMALCARGQNVEKLFFVEPGANPTDIQLTVEGAKDLSVKENGELELVTASGVMRFSKPIAYQEIDGKRSMVGVGYLVSKNTYGFALGDYDPSQKLVIDPLITVFPISHNMDDNLIMALAVDGDGNIYAAGDSADQLVVFKLDSKLEKMLASIYFSEWANYCHDLIRCMALDSMGNVVVAGSTWNQDFPITEGCHDNRLSHPPYYHGPEWFVTKLSADLQTIVASTFVGGDYMDKLNAMVLDANDNVFVAGYSVTGQTDEQQFPVTPDAFDVTPINYYQHQGAIAKLDNNLSKVLAATYLGGHECDKMECEDAVHCLAIDADGNLWAAGRTTYPDFPVTDDSFDPTYNGEGDVFLSKLDPDLSQLLMSTHIGGLENEAPSDILFDDQGNLFLLGWTYSSDFPIPDGGYQPDHGHNEEDGFILKMTASGNEILAGTFIGAAYDGSGKGDDVPTAMAFSADGGTLHVVGRTESATFPTTADCFNNVIDNGDTSVTGSDVIGPTRDSDDPNWGDGFLVTFSTDLTQLIYSTFVGGDSCDYFDDVVVNGSDIIIAGETQSLDFPMAIDDMSENYSRGILLRFSDTATTPTDPSDTDNPENTDDSGNGGGDSGGGDGGGGGCFVTTSAANSHK